MSITVYNFNSGPAMLPRKVLNVSRNSVDNFNGTGLSILEIGFRGSHFDEIANSSERLLIASIE